MIRMKMMAGNDNDAHAVEGCCIAFLMDINIVENNSYLKTQSL